MSAPNPPECWHCHQGTFSEIEPMLGTPCCDHCGRDAASLPGGLPGFDNAGTIPRTVPA